MAQLRHIAEGTFVRVIGSPTIARVLRQNSGSVLVELGNNKITWSQDAQVTAVPQAGSQAPSVLPDVKQSGLKAIDKEPAPVAVVRARKPPKPPTPKAPPKGKDQFGVTMGSAAAKTNEILVGLKSDVTVDAILAKDKTLVRSNIKSHLRRMARDGLIQQRSGKDNELYWSLNGVVSKSNSKKSKKVSTKS